MRFSPKPVSAYVHGGKGPGERFRFREDAWNMAWLCLPDVESHSYQKNPEMEQSVLIGIWPELSQALTTQYPIEVLNYLDDLDLTGHQITEFWLPSTWDTIVDRAVEADKRLRGYDTYEPEFKNVIHVNFKRK